MPHAEVIGDAPGLEAAVAALRSHVERGHLPVAVLEVGDGRRRRGVATFETGRDVVFDLASLTKVLGTGLVAVDLFARRRLDLDSPVSRYSPLWQGADRRHVTVRDLLAHASGLPAHLPLYAAATSAEDIVAGSASAPLAYPPRTANVYSDLGFIVLGDLLARLVEAPWSEAVRQRLTTLTDDPPAFAVPPGRDVAGTGWSAWRHRSLCGDVHDDNAAALGGAAGHAGLFGSAGGVGDIARAILRSLREHRHLPFAPAWALRAFARRSPVPGSSRALAWDTALPTSSSGPFLSRRAIGHTGFTGTSLWIDPQLDLYVVLLTNRVAGSATADVMSGIRRTVHATIGAAWRRVEAG